MSIQNKYNEFGKKIVEKLRDENYKSYLKQNKLPREISLEEYYKLPRNNEYDPSLQKIDDERFEFINSLSNKQKAQLDKLILKTLDESAYNLLRTIEEDFFTKKSIGLTYEGKSLEEIYGEFLSGSFFGEYFLWIGKFSGYGGYQY
tara:strand:- start:1335 stop:1772 length:438 start_codon:yes stop_codon:yes gene_type:complete